MQRQVPPAALSSLWDDLKKG